MTRRTWRLFTAVGGAAVATVAGALARRGPVEPFEERAFRTVNAGPPVLEAPFLVLQAFGLNGTPAVLAAVAVARGRRRLALALALALPAKLAVEFGVAKRLVHRARPAATIAAIEHRDGPAEGRSFPSGHTFVAVTTATLLAPHLMPAGRRAVVGLALLTAVGRVFLGAHHPLDVVGGAGCGLALGSMLDLVAGAGG